jgi:hypothetical protein
MRLWFLKQPIEYVNRSIGRPMLTLYKAASGLAHSTPLVAIRDEVFEYTLEFVR